MLIPSHRHRPEDLALWAELEAADIAHSAMLMRSGKVERSMEAIKSFATNGPCYASVSWGKDSVVLAHLVRLASPHVPLVHLRGVPTGNPDCLAVRDNFLSQRPGAYKQIDVVYQSLDVAGVDEWQVDGNKLWSSTMKAQGERYLSGIRADESGGRKIRMRRHGLTSKNACAPLGWWTAADVFGYLAIRGLPVHPVYAMLGGGRWQRSQVRTDELMGASGNQFGRREWEQEYYGDVLRRLSVLPSRPTPR